MYTMSSQATMSPRPKQQGYPDANLSLRLTGEEAERYDEVLRRALQRHPRANKSEVVRRLLGLDRDSDGLVTESDRLYFQGKAIAELPVKVGTAKPRTVARVQQKLDSATQKEDDQEVFIIGEATLTPDSPRTSPRKVSTGTHVKSIGKDNRLHRKRS